MIIGETGERLTILNWYQGQDHQLARIEFGDGITWTRAEINAMMPVLRGTDGVNDTIRGFDGQNNILIGGIGENLKIGGTGRNIYKWELGTGNDTIDDWAFNKSNMGQSGTLKIGKGVNPANVEVGRSGNDLILVIGETGERVTILNWHQGQDHQLAQIKFGDGTVWSRANINAMPMATLSNFSANAFADTGLNQADAGGNAQVVRINLDIIESHIALAMRQMNTDSGIVGNFHTEKKNSSFEHVSFNPHFEQDKFGSNSWA